MTQENWKEKFNKDYRDFIKVVKVGQYDEKGVNIGFKESYNLIEDFISTLLAEERELQNKLREIAINNLITDVNTARKEERQFILNVLDGIDIADKEMGVTGGTQAIRQALQSRI